jgi:hypothetical protein
MSNLEQMLKGWPGCAVPDCPNKCCKRLDSPYCWPHTVGVSITWAEDMPIEQSESLSTEIEAKWRAIREVKEP